MIDLDLIKPEITFTERDADPRRPPDVPDDVADSVAGYLEVYRRTDSGQWFAYQASRGGSSRSQGFATPEEAVDECHRIVRFFAWEFWAEKITWAFAGDRDEHGQRVIRADGWHFVLCGDTGGMRGYGGRRFRFRLTDGSMVESANVWSQGAIPPELRDLLPDNATQVTASLEVTP
jgi:hypothetical protein